MVENLVLASMMVATLAAVLAAWQLIRGPDAATRSVSLDALTLVTMPVIVGLAIITGREILIDVALVYAVLSFLGVIALARYFDKGI